MMGGRGKSYDEPRDMAGRRLPSSSEDDLVFATTTLRQEGRDTPRSPTARARKVAHSRSARSARPHALVQEEVPDVRRVFWHCKGRRRPRRALEAHPVARVREHRGPRAILRVEELRERLESRRAVVRGPEEGAAS